MSEPLLTEKCGCACCRKSSAALRDFLGEIKTLTQANFGLEQELARAASRERKLEAEVARLTLRVDELSMGGNDDE